MPRCQTSCLRITLISLPAALNAADWRPANGPLMTRWAKDVSPDNALPEYPRPQMVRDQWKNLNGLWDYAIRPKLDPRPETFAGQILVPFPIESALSGVMKRVGPAERTWYRRKFTVPADWTGKHILLHCGAVDWETSVWINGRKMGEHRGGYDGFSFDVTESLKPGGEQEIVLSAWNPLDAGTQPRGKQVRQPEGIFYTPSSGIWQTVWLEPVGDVSIDAIRITPDLDRKSVHIALALRGDAARATPRIIVAEGEKRIAEAAVPATGATRMLDQPIDNPKLWSPDSPFLYDLNVELVDDNGRSLDCVRSYFGMRKISVEKDPQGVARIFLNNKPLFMFGPLDQGFWPDGLYTAPTDAALRSDIETMRKLGFNLARKHVKVEPDRWYYWADKLGLLVWQDMPSGGASIGDRQPDLHRSPESAAQYELELRRMIEGRMNHPSIVMWVVFNEGWGQFDTPRITRLAKHLDPSRLVDCASGWADRGVGDVHDAHFYPGPGAAPTEEHRAVVLGEFGGLGLPLPGHTWQSQKNWSYRGFPDRDKLTDAYIDLIGKLRPLIDRPGLSAAVYTQITDVETESNGLMTYDREIVKPDRDRVKAANRQLLNLAASSQ